jgi:hypothetical protein
MEPTADELRDLLTKVQLGAAAIVGQVDQLMAILRDLNDPEYDEMVSKLRDTTVRLNRRVDRESQRVAKAIRAREE